MLNYTITSATTVTVAAGSPKPAGRLTIPDTVRGYYVTAVANSGFSDCRGLLSVNIPGSVATIGTRAFSGCESMTSAYLAEGVLTIGQMAFSSCTALDTVSLPTTLTQISAGSFGNTAVLNRREHWQDSVLYVGNYLIASMPQRTGTIVLADGTLGIANIAFDNCNIAKCVVPQGFHFIGEQAFMSCTHLDTVHRLDTVPPTPARTLPPTSSSWSPAAARRHTTRPPAGAPSPLSRTPAPHRPRLPYRLTRQWASRLPMHSPSPPPSTATSSPLAVPKDCPSRSPTWPDAASSAAIAHSATCA